MLLFFHVAGYSTLPQVYPIMEVSRKPRFPAWSVSGVIPFILIGRVNVAVYLVLETYWGKVLPCDELIVRVALATSKPMQSECSCRDCRNFLSLRSAGNCSQHEILMLVEHGNQRANRRKEIFKPMQSECRNHRNILSMRIKCWKLFAAWNSHAGWTWESMCKQIKENIQICTQLHC